MATRSDHTLLPLESAAALYSAIEMLGVNLRKEQSAHNERYTADQREAARQHESLRGTLDEIKDLLRDGNVKFAQSDATMRLHSEKIDHLGNRVDGVESDIQAAITAHPKHGRHNPNNTGSGLERARRSTWHWVKDHFFKMLVLLAAALAGYVTTKINEISHPPSPDTRNTSLPLTPVVLPPTPDKNP